MKSHTVNAKIGKRENRQRLQTIEPANTDRPKLIVERSKLNWNAHTSWTIDESKNILTHKQAVHTETESQYALAWRVYSNNDNDDDDASIQRQRFG